MPTVAYEKILNPGTWGSKKKRNLILCPITHYTSSLYK